MDVSSVPLDPASKSDPFAMTKSRDKTWGEKVFDRSVYGVAGYGVNLFLSALISYFILENKHGAGFANFLREKFYKKTLGLKDPSTIDTMTNAFTLLTGGHIVATMMIKPAEDHKSEIVRWLDKKHYGENAEQDPEIRQAHERIDHEASPTFLGILAARMSSWGIVQLAAYSVGNKENFINKFGKKYDFQGLTKFKGIELHSKDTGTFIADRLTPSSVRNGFNTLYKPLVNPEASGPVGLTSSGKSPLLQERQKTVYKEVMEYTAMDVFYTAITAATIKPVNKFLMKHIPLFRHSKEEPQAKNPTVKTAYFLDRPADIDQPKPQAPSGGYEVNSISHDGLLAQPQLQKA